MKKIMFFMAVLFFATFTAVAFADEGPLKFPMREGSNASAHEHNEEGINHYNQGHYDVALQHFQTASKIDPMVGEAHYNAALCLHNMKKHGEATNHFYAARKYSHGNKKIEDSVVLNKHAPMESKHKGMKEGS
jgi:tetratricopeptide (TPR) repeat protein